MNHTTSPAPLHPLIGIAICCGIASISIAALAFCLLRYSADSGLWAIAAMTAAPSLMGIVLAFFMTKSRQATAPSLE